MVLVAPEQGFGGHDAQFFLYIEMQDARKRQRIQKNVLKNAPKAFVKKRMWQECTVARLYDVAAGCDLTLISKHNKECWQMCEL